DVSPQALAAMGAKHHRPDWVVAADVLGEYLDVTALKAPGAFDAAELIQRANAELRANPELLAAERGRRRRIFVDEYQDTDPAQIELLKLIAAGADELVLIGDPDQAIYSFRGAEQTAMADIDLHFGWLPGTPRPDPEPVGQLQLSTPVETVTLTQCRRSGPVLLAASRQVAARLPGPAQHRALVAAPDLGPGTVEVAVFSSASQEAAHIASVLRRAHVEDGVPWSGMAVLVRSLGPAADSLRRGLVAAGVPVGQAVRGPLAEEPVVAQLLELLRCVADPAAVQPEAAEALLLGPVGRADPLQLLRIRRHLRRAPAGPLSLADLVTEPGALALVPAAVRPPVERLRAVIDAGVDAGAASGSSAEDVLWALWQASGLAPRLNARSLAGGPDSARADRSLDAVLALFTEAAKLSDRSPGSGIAQLHDWVSQLQITDTTPTRPAVAEEVSILTAHASKGLEWQVVCVAGVSDGVWPNLRRRGSLLGSDLLVDLLACRAPVSSGLLGERLAEERRLFYVAVTRASRALLVTAVDSDEAQPSRFLEELDPLPDTVQARPVVSAARRFQLPSLVAELRAVLVDSDAAEDELAAAAEQLAKLAAAGVPGAHPADWWGRAPLSTDAPIRPPSQGPVPIRPSKFSAYTDCQLRALLMELGATDTTDEVAASLGTLVHWVAEQAQPDAGVEELAALLEQGWSRLEFAAPWYAATERDRAQRMLHALASWLAGSRTELTLVAREEPFQVRIGDAVLSGKVDRLEQDSDGRLVVIDLKTSKSKPTKQEVAVHPQLALYQLAVAEGGFTGGEPTEPGGARLVQVGASRPGEQAQAPLTEFDDPGWVAAEVRKIAEVLRGNSVTAQPGKGCSRCLVRGCCPAQDDGRQVTQ
ncbi:MAG: hypothetical protein QOE77_4106, partial [Blastocatellia bacterium]|nr:hypothetical protein [Blastocatellia bacterium]